jgi:phosphoribosyl-ATP pyrophosphohydrolase
MFSEKLDNSNDQTTEKVSELEVGFSDKIVKKVLEEGNEDLLTTKQWQELVREMSDELEDLRRQNKDLEKLKDKYEARIYHYIASIPPGEIK